MKISNRRTGHWRASHWLLVLVSALLGCSSSNQPTASGRVLLPSSSAFSFAGDTIELRHQNDPKQVAFGQIQPDGSFKIESLVGGQVVPGAPAGTYKARVVISDDDYQHKTAASNAISKKFFSFETSSLVVEIPNHNIQLQLTN